LCFAKRKQFSKDSFVALFTNSACSFSISAHFSCTAATVGKAFGLNRASRRFLNPLAPEDVHQRVSHRTKAASQIARELLSGEKPLAKLYC